MPQLDITRSFEDGDVLFDTDLDNIHSAVTTLNNTTKYDDDNIQASAIGTTHLQDNTVDTTRIATSAITTSKITDANVTTAKLETSTLSTTGVATAKIADLAVTEAKLEPNAVTSDKVSTAAKFSYTKIEERYVGTGTNASSTTRTTSDVSSTTIASHTTTRTLTGPILIMLQPYNNTSSYVELTRDLNTNAGGLIGTIAFYDGATSLASRQFGISESSTSADTPTLRIPLSSFKALIVNTTITSGSVIRAYLSPVIAEGSAAGTATVTACKLVVIEL